MISVQRSQWSWCGRIVKHLYRYVAEKRIQTHYALLPDGRSGAKGFVIFVWLRRSCTKWRGRPDVTWTSFTCFCNSCPKAPFWLSFGMWTHSPDMLFMISEWWDLIITSPSSLSRAASRAWHGLQATHRHLQPLHQTRQLSHTCETKPWRRVQTMEKLNIR